MRFASKVKVNVSAKSNFQKVFWNWQWWKTLTFITFSSNSILMNDNDWNHSQWYQWQQFSANFNTTLSMMWKFKLERCNLTLEWRSIMDINEWMTTLFISIIFDSWIWQQHILQWLTAIQTAKSIKVVDLAVLIITELLCWFLIGTWVKHLPMYIYT